MQQKNEENIIFSQLYGRYVKLWSFVESFRYISITCLSLKDTYLHLREFHRQGFQELIKDSDFQNALSDVIYDNDKFNQILDEGVNTVLKNTKIPINAASIVFMHSILEATLFELLKLTLKLDPNEWLQYIDEKKLIFRSIREQTKEKLQAILFKKCLNDLLYKSIIAKCKRIFDICKFPHNYQLLSNYTYDETKLKEIDTLRHNIVHGLQINTSIDDIDENLRYLKQTGSYFILMLNRKYNLRVDLGIMRTTLL